jgi:outer membrane lipoprotein-sorting protein
MRKLRLFSVALICATGAAQGLTGMQVLDRLRGITYARDRKATATMTITDRNRRVQSRRMRMVMKGDSKMMMTFEAPADLRGVTFLTTSVDNMWIYLPAQGRVRRVSGSMAEQGFGGSDFSYKEMANISFADETEVVDMADAKTEGGPAYLLSLKGKGGDRSRLWVEKARFLPLQLEKLDGDDKPTKRVLFSEFQNQDSSWIPALIKMQDLSRGSTTELKLERLELNTGVKDNLFVESNMKKGA